MLLRAVPTLGYHQSILSCFILFNVVNPKLTNTPHIYRMMVFRYFQILKHFFLIRGVGCSINLQM